VPSLGHSLLTFGSAVSFTTFQRRRRPDDQRNAFPLQDDPKPPMSHENLIINELIREYLDYNQYKHTLSVLLPETGQPAERIERSFSESAFRPSMPPLFHACTLHPTP
jgi:hypothetical protein